MEHLKDARHPAAVVLNNEYLRVVALPEVGFKIRSIYFKPKRFEALFQPKGALCPEHVSDEEIETADWGRGYRRPFPGAHFSDYDTSGLDDAIPSIDPCRIPQCADELNDHGDAWSGAWTPIDFASRSTLSHGKKVLADQRAAARLDLPSMPLRLEREIALVQNVVRLRYRLENLGAETLPWLWALHDLARFDDGAVLELGDTAMNYENVQNDEVWNFDIRLLRNYPRNHTFKFYGTQPVREGDIGIRYPKQGVRYRLRYDPEQLPYLGVWITTGGFKGESNIALEPTNGYYDRLDRAIANRRVGWIEAGQRLEWQVDIVLEELEDTRGSAD